LSPGRLRFFDRIDANMPLRELGERWMREDRAKKPG
jgi:hypothetical protein